MSDIKFVLVDAVARTVRVDTFRNLAMAKQAVGLSSHGVDIGTLHPGLAYVVFEYGLFDPPEKQHYWRYGRLLIAGNAVLFAYAEGGETESISEYGPEEIEFFPDADHVEQAIETGIIDRPVIRLNGRLLWEWPDPDPWKGPTDV